MRARVQEAFHIMCCTNNLAIATDLTFKPFVHASKVQLRWCLLVTSLRFLNQTLRFVDHCRIVDCDSGWPAGVGHKSEAHQLSLGRR